MVQHTKSYRLKGLSLPTGITNSIIVVLAFACGCAVMFLFIDYGDHLYDEIYQTLCVRRYRESPLGLLTFWIGNQWTSIFGFSFISLRILTSIELLLSMAVASCYTYILTKNIRLSSLMFFLGCVLLRIGSFYIYNWDTGTYLFDTLAVCALISIISKPTLSKAILLGLFISLMSMGRIPSVVFLPVSLIIVWLSLKEYPLSNKCKLISTVVLSCLVFSVLLCIIILGSPANYIHSFQMGNIISGHDPVSNHKMILNRLVFNILNLPERWFAGTFSLIISLICSRIKNLWVSSALLTVWIILCILISYWMTPTSLGIYLTLGIDTPLSLGLLIVLPVYSIFTHNYTSDYKLKLKLWACAAIFICMAFGSDGFTERMVSAFTLPIIVGLLWNLRAKNFHKFLKSFCFITTLTFTAMYITHIARFVSIMSRDSELATVPPYTGLHLKSYYYDEIQRVDKAINFLKESEIPYAYLGNHLVTELIFGPDQGLSFQQYHYVLDTQNQWNLFKDDILPRINAVVCDISAPQSEYPEIIRDLERYGFTRQYKLGDALIIFRNNYSIKDIPISE